MTTHVIFVLPSPPRHVSAFSGLMVARIGASTNGERLLVCLTACVGPNNTLQHRLGETRHMNGRPPSINHTSRFEQDTCLSVFALLLSTCQETFELSPHGGNACAYDDGTRADRRFGTDRIIVYPRRGCVYLFVFLQSRYVQQLLCMTPKTYQLTRIVVVLSTKHTLAACNDTKISASLTVGHKTSRCIPKTEGWQKQENRIARIPCQARIS